jgi:hypothetical protein
MKLSELKGIISNLDSINFILPNGSFVPKHFHVTEVGKIERNFIDCGGTVRNDTVINFQLWEDGDFDHRLAPEKLISIIDLSEKVLGLPDKDIEVEYQGETVGKYGLEFENDSFMLTNTQTDCLAKDACGIPGEKKKISMSSLGETEGNSCSPESGCC